MEQPNDVVVPLDGTRFGERAIPTAVSFATAVHARIELVHVASTDSRDEDFAYLDELAGTIAGVEVAVRVEPTGSDPAGGRSDDEYLVCMATHGHGGVPGVLLGRVADDLLQSTSAPFLLVGPSMDPGAVPNFEGGHLLLCFDGSEHAASMAPLAASLARVLDADIQVAMVLHRHGEFLGDHDAAHPKAQAQELVDDLTGQGLRAELHLLDGLEPGRTISHLAEELPATLIVTSTHGSRGFVRSVIGSTAMRIVQHAPCPVLARRPS